MFAFDSIYLTPPQTPVLLVDEANKTDDNDIDDIEMELLTVNYTTVEKKFECNEDKNSTNGLYIRRDLMWGTNSDITMMDSESSFSCNEKRLRDRALITPLNFSSAEDYEDGESDKEISDDDTFKERLLNSSLDIFNHNELLFSPTETESSEDEIDVVGLQDDELISFSRTAINSIPCNNYTRNDHPNKNDTIANYSSDEQKNEMEESISSDPMSLREKMDSDYIKTARNSEKQSTAKFTHKKSRRKRSKIKEESISTDTGSSSSEESSSAQKKSRVFRKLPKSHNSSEKKRRDVLKCKFIELRQCIPELWDFEKAPKIVILSQAKDLINELREEENVLIKEKEKEIEQKEILSKKIVAMETFMKKRFEETRNHSLYTIQIP